MLDDSVTAVRLTVYEYEELNDCETALEAAIKGLKTMENRELLECVRLRWSKSLGDLNAKFKNGDPSEHVPIRVRQGR